MTEPVHDWRFADLTPEDLLLLRDRARQTAIMPAAAQSDEQLDLLEFRSKNQTFALPLSAVAGITELLSIAPVPRAHRLLRGLVSFRGEVLIATETSSIAGGEGSGIADLRRLVALSADGLKLAILVERIISVRQARATSFHANPSLGQGHRFVVGTDEQFVSLLDPAKLIAYVFQELGGGTA
jgi:chemotaxis signal transduction protein